MCASMTSVISIIFGGCCGSVATLETLIKDKSTFDQNTNVGKLVTFCQFIFITLMTLPRFIVFTNVQEGKGMWALPRLKPLHVPLRIYIISVLLFFSSSVGNNMIFNYNITIPLHITFRCFSTVLTMMTCYLVNGKRYTRLQVGSTIFLTIGALIASLYRDHDFHWKDIYFWHSMEDVGTYDSVFLQGLLILLASSIMSSLLSAYNERTYTTYGKHWEENMFYCHLLSIPLFVVSSHKELWNTMSKLVYASPKYKIINVPMWDKTFYVSQSLITLVGNLITQNVCITGVNMLASHTGALTLSIVLLVRKFVSLLLSVVFFNNKLSQTAYIGILIVFFGAFLYSLGSTPSTKPIKNQNTK